MVGEIGVVAKKIEVSLAGKSAESGDFESLPEQHHELRFLGLPMKGVQLR
jgi:hypothetical protein